MFGHRKASSRPAGHVEPSAIWKRRPAELSELNSLNPEQMYSRAHEGQVAKLFVHTVISLAHGESPAILKGEGGSSRATRGTPSKLTRESAELATRMSFSKDSLNVIQASNPSASIRQILSAKGKQSFSMAVLPIKEALCRMSWLAAETSIGNGLSRPELYVSSMSTRVRKVSPPVYHAYSGDLIRFAVHHLSHPSSLVDGMVADFIALTKKNGHLESFVSMLTSDEEGCETERIERPVFSGLCIFNRQLREYVLSTCECMRELIERTHLLSTMDMPVVPPIVISKWKMGPSNISLIFGILDNLSTSMITARPKRPKNKS